MRSTHTLWLGGVLVGGCAGEGGAEAPPLTLAEASEQVTFASTEALGRHRFLATTERVERRSGSEQSRHTEVVEVRWEDWDNFRYRRSVDERPVEEVIVSGGEGWLRRGSSWERVADAEPHRTQLRMSWNAWEQAARLFGDRLSLQRAGTESVQGRPAQRYAVSLGEESMATRPGPRMQGKMTPVSLEGTLWVDEATAVRLTGQLQGTLERDGYEKELRLQLARTEIGASQDIKPPMVGRDE